MARIALPLCLAFIFIAFRQDFKESRQISQSLWIPLVWLALGASKTLTYWVHPSWMLDTPSEFDYLSGSPLERNFFIVLICVGLIVLYRRKNRFSFEFSKNTWLYLFYAYALMSVSWSDYSGVSIKRWVKLAGDVVVVLIILTEENHREAIDHVLRRCAILLIPLSVFFIRYNRQIGVYYDRSGETVAWRGVSDNKNGLGLLCAYIGIYLVWRILRGLPKLKSILLDGFLLLLTIYLLQGAKSATSNVVFVLGIIILVIEARLKGNKKKLNRAMIVALLSIFILQGLLTILLDKSSTSLFFSSTGRNASFTGRVPLWQEMIKIGSQRPILGAGYGGFWIGNLTHHLWDTFLWKPTNSHNGYLDVFIDLGLVGLVLLLLLIINSYKKIMNSFESKDKIAELRLVFFIMILLHNITESSLAKGVSFLWALFLLSSIVVVNKVGTPDATDQQAPAEIQA